MSENERIVLGLKLDPSPRTKIKYRAHVIDPQELDLRSR